ncbi:MAG TPA: hypothetical protein VFI79_09920 [Gemmatimonadales bacterium]|nr:hypothetical protein [Gemmatimonadales bacterium]
MSRVFVAIRGLAYTAGLPAWMAPIGVMVACMYLAAAGVTFGSGRVLGSPSLLFLAVAFLGLAHLIDLPEVREKMRRRPVGDRVPLLLQSHGTQRRVIVTLRDLA